ncbi:DNA-binding CsgD family transcriptional regulator [Rhodococcus sp. 27YEA15]|uniref:LuxR C-terminal-related transcriptional regulator n=1 Tax=Rhodococcus sp. 27YEA15 TaxID=3156259 RepID=UPI003C7B8752
MNRRSDIESPYLSGLLRPFAASASPVRLFVVGADTTARLPVSSLLRRRIESGGSAPITTITRDVVPGSVLLVTDAQTLSPDDVRLVTELTKRDDIGVMVVSNRIDSSLGPLYSAVTTFGTALHLNPLSRSEIRDLAAEYDIRLDEDTAHRLELLSAGSFRAVSAYFESTRVQGTDMTESLRNHFHGQITGLPALARDILRISLEVPDVDAYELDFGRSVTELEFAVDCARATGLFGTSSPLAAALLTESTGAARIRACLLQIIESRSAAHTLDLDAARKLFDSGVRHLALTELFRTAAENAAPALAADLFRRLASIETLDTADMLRYAERSARVGDLDTACRLADSVIVDTHSDAAALSTAVRIRGASSTICGQLRASADLYAWLGHDRLGAESAFGAITFLGDGRIDDAHAALSARTTFAPSATVGITTLATGLVQSVTEAAPIAMNTMARALSMPGSTDTSGFQPDTIPALTALALIHNGGNTRAAAVTGIAITGDTPDSHTWARHHLLAAWASMVGGNENARDTLPHSILHGPLPDRDALFLHALLVGLARRSGDPAQLRHAWSEAAGAVASCSVDLYNLLPIGELWLAAVRLGETDQTDHLVDQALSLLLTLGEPPLWASPLHWYGVQASILSQSPEDLLPHAHALTEAAKTHSYAAGLAAAGRQWLLLLQGHVEASEIDCAARILAQIGLPWDAARLAGEAALRTPDTRTATTLLHLARSLRAGSTSALQSPGSPITEPATASAALTEREHEVAELVVAGLTYREIGERLYISAKTVEHHVARIKRRVGAQSRSELLATLRSLTRTSR